MIYERRLPIAISGLIALIAWLGVCAAVDAQIGPTRPGPQGPQGIQGIQGVPGDEGDSAYAVAVAEGFMGDEAAWLASLVGETGPQGLQGDPGVAGEDFGIDYLYESTVGTSNPGSGHLGLNNADHSLATTLVISETDANAVNVAGWLGTLDDSTSTTKGQLFVRYATDPTLYRIFNVTNVVDSGTYWTMAIDLASQNGSLSDDDGLKIAFLTTGDKGDQGIQGETGAQGPQGEIGPQGEQGVQGETGPAGADGKTVRNGTTDPSNGLGVDGDFYIKTSGTPSEWKVFGPKASGAWPAGVALQGPQGDTGAAGADGKTWHSGSGAPADGTGVNGDFYLDTGNDAYYGPKAGGTWTGTGPTSLIGPQGPQGEMGVAGMDGADGADGANGRDAGINYKFESTTTAADPGSGKLKLNNATPSSATNIYINETDDDGAGVSGLLAQLSTSTSTNKSTVLVRKIGTPATFVAYDVTAQTDNGAWRTLAVTHRASNGTISDDDELAFEFSRVGDKGDTGATGSTGSTGAAGRDAGWNWTFDSSTTNADPGSGDFRFDNATLSSVTRINISSTDDDGNSLGDVTQTWGHGTALIVGYVTITKVGTPTTFAVFGVTAETTGGAGYRAFTGAMLQSAGTFSNNDETMVSYRPSGIQASAHYAQLRRDAAQSIAHNTLTAITWDATALNSGLTVGSAGITLTRTGLYRVEWTAGFNTTDGSLLLMRPTKNGSTFAPDARISVGAAGTTNVTGSFVFSGTSGDVITASLFQNSGGSLNTLTTTESRPYLTVTEIR